MNKSSVKTEQIMLSLERQEEILEILNKNKSATVDFLANSLYVSGATIRRDLKQMEQKGMIIRSHGGAMPFKSSSTETSFVVREQKDAQAKRKIASLAVRLIKNGDSIFVDSSSSTSYVMELLQDFTNITVTTTGIRNATILSSTDKVKVYIAGGLVSNHSNSITGTDTMDYISQIHADIAILSCTGISLQTGINDASIEQAKLKQRMRKNSNKVAILADSTKFGKTFMCHDFWFDEIDYLITEKMPPQEFLEALSKTKCKLITPKTDEL